MNSTYNGSPKQKKVYLKKWVESQNGYKKRCKLAMVFKIIASVILILCIALPTFTLMGNDTLIKGFIAGAAVGFIFSLIPFSIGNSIKIKAFQEFSYPFRNIERECLRVYEDGIEYLYHNASSRYSESMDVYRIPSENINAINYNQKFHIITIIGAGELLAYDDYAEKRLNHHNSQRKFYSNSPYQIISSFDDEQQVIQLLKNMVKNRTEA